MVHRVERGGNYGWSIMEGRQPVHARRRRRADADPAADWSLPALRGGVDHRRLRLPRQAAARSWSGAYIYGDYQTRHGLGPAEHDGQRRRPGAAPELADTPLAARRLRRGRRRASCTSLDYERTDSIYRLVPNPDAGRPRRLPRDAERDRPVRLDARAGPRAGRDAVRDQRRAWADGAPAPSGSLAVPGHGRVEHRRRRGRTGSLPEGPVLARTVSWSWSAATRRAAGGWRPRSSTSRRGSWRAVHLPSGTTPRPTRPWSTPPGRPDARDR